MTQAPATPELVERLKNLATGFGVAPIYQQAADALEAQQARIAELEAERRSVIANIPMDYLKAHDAAGATAPTVSLDLVGAMRSYAEARWRIIDRCKKAEALADRYEKALSGLIEYFEDGGAHDEGAYDESCPDCQTLQLARQALSSQGRREWEQDSSSRSQPCGVGPSDLTDPQSQLSDGEG